MQTGSCAGRNGADWTRDNDAMVRTQVLRFRVEAVGHPPVSPLHACTKTGHQLSKHDHQRGGHGANRQGAGAYYFSFAAIAAACSCEMYLP